MNQNRPHFLLFSTVLKNDEAGDSAGRWHFVLESVDQGEIVEASDIEVGSLGERLELLAVVRGLEALDQPSRVTLVTCSRQVSRGFRFGLESWRSNGWQWERFGRLVPVANADLWRRIDHALEFHQVTCRTLRFDAEHESESEPVRDPFQAARRETARSYVVPSKLWNLASAMRSMMERWFSIPLAHRSAV